jgi:hypothetical protein
VSIIHIVFILRRNSITAVITAESQQPYFSTIGTSTRADRSGAVTPPLQSTPPPVHIWADRNRRPHPFIEEGGKRQLMCFEVKGTVLDYLLQSDAKYWHFITLRLSPEDILSIKNTVRGALNHSEENFQWQYHIKEERVITEIVLSIYIRLLRSKWKDKFYTTTLAVPVKWPDVTSHSPYICYSSKLYVYTY